MSISAADVKALRERTNLPMMDCKAALVACDGDMEKAVVELRKKFKDVADKRGGKETAEGRVGAWISPDMKTGAIVEMRCESPPVVKADAFVELSNAIAKQVALKAPASVEALLAQPFVDNPSQTVADRINDTIGMIRENMKVHRFERVTGLLGAYTHHDGSVGVMVVAGGDKADPQVLRDVAMHATARNPRAARREDLPADIINKEKEIATAQAIATGKPQNIAEKIAEGKLKTWFGENVLVEQPFVKDDKKTVGELLKGAGLNMQRFIRYKVGEVAS